MRDILDISDLLLDVVRHPIVLTTSLLQAILQLIVALKAHATTFKVVAFLAKIVNAVCLGAQVVIDSLEVDKLVLAETLGVTEASAWLASTVARIDVRSLVTLSVPPRWGQIRAIARRWYVAIVAV